MLIKNPKYFLFVLSIIILFISCKKETKTLNIILNKTEKVDSSSIRFQILKLYNSDSLFYDVNYRHQFNFRDTIIVDNLPIGTYTLEYNDIVGNLITKYIDLRTITEIKISTDSIDIEKFRNKIPLINLKNNSYYEVNMQGGCVASFYGFYKISRIQDKYYIETFNSKKRLLNPDEIKAIEKFEAELYAIDGKVLCSSTGKKTFEIITDDVKIISDNTCSWNGWTNLFSKLNAGQSFY